jgi:MoaA/NifB/PqqE/SkfB family radical SAM enzyme
MCNQWGENSYFLNGARPAGHMDEGSLRSLMRMISPRDSFLSIHGGEPFAYRHMDTLLRLIADGGYDVMFSTNGTLLRRYLDALVGIQNISLLLSIDGDEQAHDRIRGEGSYREAYEALSALMVRRREAGLPLPLVIMSCVVCEWNSSIIEEAYDVARKWGVAALNYNMRWFLTEEVGKRYEEHLKSEFGLTSSGAWRGWISNAPGHDYSEAARALQRMTTRWNRLIHRPFVFTTPSQLRGEDFNSYFRDYLNVFGNESCFMPFYWARIHSNGDLIYCPGHPDIIAGNVFRQPLEKVFNSEQTIRFRKYILRNRLPICNRCCGLYMTNAARGFEQRARRNLHLGTHVAVHYP